MDTLTGWIGLENALKGVKGGCFENDDADLIHTQPSSRLKGCCFQPERKLFHSRSAENLEGTGRSPVESRPTLLRTPFPVSLANHASAQLAASKAPVSQQLAVLLHGQRIDKAQDRRGSCAFDRRSSFAFDQHVARMTSTPRDRTRCTSRTPPPHSQPVPALHLLPSGAPPFSTRGTSPRPPSPAAVLCAQHPATPAPPGRSISIPPTYPQPHARSSRRCSSRAPATPTRSVSCSPAPSSAACQTCDLQIGQQQFDPNLVTIKSIILSRLGFAAHSTIECHSSNHGGLNEGVWTVKDPAQPSQEVVLKLVSAHRGEADIFATLARQHPGICADPLLTFPKVVFNCLGSRGEKRYDLLAMRRAPGISVAEFMAEKHFTKKMSQIFRVLAKIGTCLSEFHSQYNDAQHGDFSTSNIFYDEATDKVTFIDFAGMGPKGRCSKSDVEHFVNALRICATSYGPQLLTDGARNFEAGYRMHRSFGRASGLVSI